MSAFYPTADNPVPPGGDVFALVAGDGVQLRAAYWTAQSTPRGTVILLQGRSEVIEKYFEIVAELLQRGFAVATLDWRGQGASARLLENPLKGHLLRFADFRLDLAALLAALAEKRAEGPFIVLAHSMGALVALEALHAEPQRFKGAILTSPLLGIKAPLPGPAARIFATFGPAQSFVPGGARFDPLREAFATNPVTNDGRRFARNIGIVDRTPQLALGSPTFGWVSAAYGAIARVMAPRFANALNDPLLMFSAGEEKIVDNRAIARFAARLPKGRLVEIPGAKHEIMMERDEIRALFWRETDRFLAETLRL